MVSNIVFILIIILSMILIKLINDNMSFIGRHKRFLMISLIGLIDLLAMYINTYIYFLLEYDLAVIVISAVLTLAVIVISLVKILEIFSEKDTEVIILKDCTIKNKKIYYKLEGTPVQGNHNTFVLLGKDGKEFESAITNGTNDFNIKYFTLTNRIASFNSISD